MSLWMLRSLPVALFSIALVACGDAPDDEPGDSDETAPPALTPGVAPPYMPPGAGPTPWAPPRGRTSTPQPVNAPNEQQPPPDAEPTQTEPPDQPEETPVAQDDPAPPAELTFLLVNEVRIDKFGSNADFPGLINGFIDSLDVDTTEESLLMTVRNMSESSTFPIETSAVGGVASYDAAANAWTYPSGYALELDGLSIDAGGQMSIARPQTFNLELSGLALSLERATLTGQMYDSGAVAGIRNASIRGCISQQTFDGLLSLAPDGIGDIVASFAVADCDLDGQPGNEAYEAIVVTQPYVVQLLP